MTPERWERVSELFEAVLQQETDQRRAFLWRECGGYRELIEEVESLVRSHQDGGELTLPATLDPGALLRETWRQASSCSAPDPHVGTTVAHRYRIDADR